MRAIREEEEEEEMSTWIVHTSPISADHYTRALADANAAWTVESRDIEELFSSVRPVGSGSFGMVFRVMNFAPGELFTPLAGQDYALKVFYNTTSEGDEFARQELRAALQFHYVNEGDCARHPHVLCYLGHFRAPFARFSRQDHLHHEWQRKPVAPDDTLYHCIVTRFIASENMLHLVYDDEQRFRFLGRLARHRFDIPPRAFARLLMTAADGLRSLHAAGMWHHDVKPANMQALHYDIEQLAETILIDLGGACTRFEHCLSVTTPGYAPPVLPIHAFGTDEAVVFSELCSRDIYALGVSFAQLALRNATYFPDVTQHHQHANFIGVRVVDQLLQNMMHVDWHRRPTAEDVVAFMGRWLV